MQLYFNCFFLFNLATTCFGRTTIIKWKYVQRKLIQFFKPHLICNMYIYIQQIGVRIGCYGLGEGDALISALP
jgi:hypothetical protein